MATSAVSGRATHSNVYKPAGVKAIQTGIPWVDGGSTSITSKIDLALPIRGLRLKVSGRYVIGTADFTTAFPEGLLNLLAGIKVEGTNSRQNGNAVLWDLDLATLWGISHLFQHRAGIFTINGTSVAIPGTPFPVGYFAKAQGTYDFTIVCDLPFHPFKAPEGQRAGYLVREQEWSDSLSVSLKYGTQAGGGVTGSLGVAAATSTIAYHARGSGAGTPTVDLYSLPVQMGHLKNSVLPGIVSRVARPINTVLQGVGTGVTLLQLQKQRTARIYLKSGTATVAPAFTTLDDSNVTAVGLQTGGANRNIKPLVDIDAYKHAQASDYSREPIQGYTCFDFLESGNIDSSFPGHNPNVVGAGSSFELTGNVAGEGDGYGIIVQEQVTHLHGGQLYSF